MQVGTNLRDVKSYKFDAIQIRDMITDSHATITFVKHTLEGTLSIQFYLDSGIIKMDNNCEEYCLT